MLHHKDLKNRVYSGKHCVRFEVAVPIGNNMAELAQFFKEPNETSEQETWMMRIVFDRTRDKDAEVYAFRYTLPKANIPLELIAATGLKYFQLKLKEEIQNKSNLDFMLGDMLSGM